MIILWFSRASAVCFVWSSLNLRALSSPPCMPFVPVDNGRPLGLTVRCCCFFRSFSSSFLFFLSSFILSLSNSCSFFAWILATLAASAFCSRSFLRCSCCCFLSSMRFFFCSCASSFFSSRSLRDSSSSSAHCFSTSSSFRMNSLTSNWCGPALIVASHIFCIRSLMPLWAAGSTTTAPWASFLGRFQYSSNISPLTHVLRDWTSELYSTAESFTVSGCVSAEL